MGWGDFGEKIAITKSNKSILIDCTKPGRLVRDSNPKNEREVNKQAKSMDMVCHFSTTIPGKKGLNSGAGAH